jgi:hypothetical protein
MTGKILIKPGVLSFFVRRSSFVIRRLPAPWPVEKITATALATEKPMGVFSSHRY